MAVSTGTFGVVKVGANVVAAVNSWTLNTRVEKIDVTGGATGLTTNLPGPKSADGTFSARLDPDDTAGQGALLEGASVALELHYEGEGSGNVKRAFQAYLEDRVETGGTTDANDVTWTFWSNEAVDRTAST